MRGIGVLFALALAIPVAAQDKKPPKPAAKQPRQPAAHRKPTPQQIRKFDELEKKEAQQKSGGGARTAR